MSMISIDARCAIGTTNLHKVVEQVYLSPDAFF
jgi:hypothetical protein